MSDCKSLECTPKNGAGDGERNSAKKRVPVPSSRKFSARAPPLDETMKLKLKNAILEMEDRPLKKVTKARSVAEIHPTKCKVKRRSASAVSTEEVTVHATPRPFDDEPAPSTSGRCLRDSIVCKLYQRLLLNAWRHSKTRLTALTESSKRQQDQISQLEMQITVLKNLSKSEIEKRNEALVECQKTKTSLEHLESENVNLQQNLHILKSELSNYRKNLKNAKLELHHMAENLNQSQISLKQQLEENSVLRIEVSHKEDVVKNLDLNVEHLENTLNDTKCNLQNMESLYNLKQQECEALVLECDKKTDLNYTLEAQLEFYKEHNINMEKHIEKLQDELADNISRLEMIKQENESMKNNIEEISYELKEERVKSWWKNLKQMAALSVSALDSAAQIMLPAYIQVESK